MSYSSGRIKATYSSPLHTQLQLLAVGMNFTAPSEDGSHHNGSLHTLDVFKHKNSTLLATMVAQVGLPKDFSAPFRMYLERALQEYSDIIDAPFAVVDVQRHGE